MHALLHVNARTKIYTLSHLAFVVEVEHSCLLLRCLFCLTTLFVLLFHSLSMYIYCTHTVVVLRAVIFEVLVVWLIVASGEGGWHLLSGQRTAERTRTSGRRAIHATFRAPRFVPLLYQVFALL